MHFDHRASRTIPAPAIEALGPHLTPYIAQLRRVVEIGGYGRPESLLVAPHDEFMLTAVETVVERVYSSALRYVFVIAIGGSSLGTKAIYEALAKDRDLLPHQLPRLIFIESSDSSQLAHAEKLIERAGGADELLFLIISKSGTTTETLFNSEVLLGTFATKFGRNANRVVVLSETGSPLLAAATEQQMQTLALPPSIGGRYSVFTPVGLLPLALLGLDIRALRAAAEMTVERSLHPDVLLNPAALSALTQYYYYSTGVRQHDVFLFSASLESLGKWYRQLIGESIGKTASDGRTAIGITPTVSVGSTDLHSVGQLYLGGPKDRLTTFVQVTKPVREAETGSDMVFESVSKHLARKTATTVTNAILEGTKSAYNANQLPFLSITLDTVSLAELGAFMQHKMCETLFLAHLLGVNPFDQPHVEQYKSVTRQLLGQ